MTTTTTADNAPADKARALPTTTRAGTGANVVLTSRDIKPITGSGIDPAPVIDADHEQTKALWAQWSKLYKTSEAIRGKYRIQCDKERAPITAEMAAIIKKIDALAPKPRCFGTKDACELPTCEECIHVHTCVKMAKAGGQV